MFIRDGNQDIKLDNRDKEYEFGYHQGKELKFYFEILEKKLGCYYEYSFAIQSITFRDPLKSSQRVLEKIGFEYMQNVDMHGYDRFYALKKI